MVKAIEAVVDDPADPSRPSAARGRDHLAGVVRRRSIPGDAASTSTARSTRAATPTRARSSSRPAVAQQRPHDGPARATSSRSRRLVRRLDAHDAALRRRARPIDIADAARRASRPAPTSTGASRHRRRPNVNGRPEQRAVRRSPSRSSSRATRPATTLTGQDRRNLYLHRDQDLLPRLPARSAGRGRRRRRRRRRLVAARSPTSTATTATSCLRRLATASSTRCARRHRAAGLAGPHATRCRSTPAATASRAARSTQTTSAARSSPRSRSATSTATASPRSIAADMEGKVYGWNADGTPVFERESRTRPTPASRCRPFVNVRQRQGQSAPSTASSARRCSPTSTATAAQEVIAAAMDRHVYAWHGDSNGDPGRPRLPGARRRPVQGLRRSTRRPTRPPSTPPAPSPTQGAIVDTPAVGDLDGDGQPEIVVGTNEEYAEDAQRSATPAGSRGLARVGAGLARARATRGSTRSSPTGGSGLGPAAEPTPCVPGWPSKSACCSTELAAGRRRGRHRAAR